MSRKVLIKLDKIFVLKFLLKKYAALYLIQDTNNHQILSWPNYHSLWFIFN